MVGHGGRAVAAPAAWRGDQGQGRPARGAPPGRRERFRLWARSDSAFCSTTWTAPLVRCAGDSTHAGSWAGLGHPSEPLKLSCRLYALAMPERVSPGRTAQGAPRSPTCPHSTGCGVWPCSASWACTPASTSPSGGFFLLDSFFALSGFLITSLLIVEWRKRGTIKLGAFWARRARRLLPALFFMLIGVAVIYGDLRPRRHLPDPAGRRAVRHSSMSPTGTTSRPDPNYFHMTGLTSPLIHTWSLAVEEQFYLVWPLVFLGVMKLDALVAGASRRGRRGRAGLCGRDGAALQPHQHQPPLLRHRHPCAVRAGGSHAGHRPAPVGGAPEEGRRDELAGAHALGAPGADGYRRHRSRRQHRLVHHGALRRRLRLPGRVPHRRARRVRRPPQRLVRPVLAAGAAALVPSLHLHRADLLRHVPLAPSRCSSSSTSSGPA